MRNVSAIAREIGSKNRRGCRANNIANVYKDRDELQNARRYYEESLALEKKSEHNENRYHSFNLAGAEITGDLPASQKMLRRRSRSPAKSAQKQITMSINELADIFYHKNDLAAAQKAAEGSLTVAAKRTAQHEARPAEFGAIVHARNDFGAAREYLENRSKSTANSAKKAGLPKASATVPPRPRRKRPADAANLAATPPKSTPNKKSPRAKPKPLPPSLIAHLVTAMSKPQRRRFRSRDLASSGESNHRALRRIAEARVFGGDQPASGSQANFA